MDALAILKLRAGNSSCTVDLLYICINGRPHLLSESNYELKLSSAGPPGKPPSIKQSETKKVWEIHMDQKAKIGSSTSMLRRGLESIGFRVRSTAAETAWLWFLSSLGPLSIAVILLAFCFCSRPHLHLLSQLCLLCELSFLYEFSVWIFACLLSDECQALRPGIGTPFHLYQERCEFMLLCQS